MALVSTFSGFVGGPRRDKRCKYLTPAASHNPSSRVQTGKRVGVRRPHNILNVLALLFLECHTAAALNPSGPRLVFSVGQLSSRLDSSTTLALRMQTCDLQVQSCPVHSAGMHPTRRLLRSSHLQMISPERVVVERNAGSSTESKGCVCRFCGQHFDSKTKLFRHLRTSSDCSEQALAEADNKSAVRAALQRHAPKRMAALVVGYDGADGGAATAEKLLKAAVQAHTGRPPLSLQITTEAKSNKHQVLEQEMSCSATADVVILKYEHIDADADALMSGINEQLHHLHCQRQHEPLHMTTSSVRVLSASRLPASSILNAGRICKHLAYHYLLPIWWLPEGRAAEMNLEEQRDVVTKVKVPRDGVHGGNRLEVGSAHDCFKKLKAVLRSVRDASDDKLSDGIKKSWHNFGDPLFKGDASPSNALVRRTLGKVWTLELSRLPEQQQQGQQDQHGTSVWHAVVEIRGDAFLKQQVRRVLGSAVAVAHGWLPADFFAIATRSDVFVETPLAPPGRLFLAGVRLDLLNNVNIGWVSGESSLFSSAKGTSLLEGSDDRAAWRRELQSCLASRCNEKHARSQEEQWLRDLRDVVAPRIRLQLQHIQEQDARRLEMFSAGDAAVVPPHSGSDSSEGDATPIFFRQTLSLLRRITAAGQWPPTSHARSQVIRSSSLLSNTASDATTEKRMSAGTFCVVNERLIAESRDSAMHSSGDGPRIPQANRQFPELAAAIFDLEQQLIESLNLHRPSSSHCAVNRNAAFLPHVDSGVGAGQSKSMIVGLGNYNHNVGGQVTVEGSSHDIWYRPLEFDGWRERHWTEPFVGERFTLVWFTPEGYLPDDGAEHVNGVSEH